MTSALRTLLACALLGAIPGLARAAEGGLVLLDKIVAEVNGDIVTLSDVQLAARPYLDRGLGGDRKKLYQEVVDQLIEDRLIKQQLAENDIQVSDDELDATIEQILRSNQVTIDQLQQMLDQQGVAMREYREQIRDQTRSLKLMDMKVRSRVVIPESDLRHEYERRMRTEDAKVMVSISHIMLRYSEAASKDEKARVLAAAREARRRVTSGGEAFTEVAQEISEGPTASKGGSLGEMQQEALMPELSRAVASLEPGQVSEPVVTSNGIHVVKVDDRRSLMPESFEELKGKIQQALYQERFEQQRKLWLDELRRAAEVEVDLDGVE